ncbi:MAG: hypothetical protein NVSMB47_08610 [Polyangiales bacterium]
MTARSSGSDGERPDDGAEPEGAGSPPGSGAAMLSRMLGSATSGPRLRFALSAALAAAVSCAAFAVYVMATSGAELAPRLAEALVARLVVLVVLVALGAFVIALGAAAVAMAPVHELTRMVHAMRRDLGVRTRMTGSDALGTLGEAVDTLVASIDAEKTSLEEDRDRLAAILESMGEGVLVTRGPAGTIALANAALREMFLLDRRIFGRPPQEVIRVAGLDDVLERAAASREGAAGEIELHGLRPRRFLVRATPLRGSHESKGGMVLVFNDVTDLRRLETMRRDFVANVSHELRTPITAIRAASETLSGGALSNAEAAREFCAIIDRNGARLQSLVEDLLELSRIEARQWQLQLEPLDLREAAQTALDTVAAAASKRGTRLVNAVPADFGAMAADRRALDQVLVNLVDNAVKYAGAAARVEVTARRVEGAVRVEVRDDGPGIEPRHLPRIFERFYRVDAGRSRAVGGTGLGLSIVKHLVEAMGGRVEVESRLGRGTAFITTFRGRSASVSADPAGPAVEPPMAPAADGDAEKPKKPAEN